MKAEVILMLMAQTRRRFLTTLSLAGAAGLARIPHAMAEEGSLETTTVRISRDLAVCEAPLEVAHELLRAEGFADIRYVNTSVDDPSNAVARGDVDFALDLPVIFLPRIDTGQQLTVLAGVHVGCFELFAREGIRTIADLKGRSVGVGSSPQALFDLMAAQVGLDPRKDFRWVSDQSQRPLELFVEGKIDAFFGFPPEPQELRARRAGNAIFNSVMDSPWSHYYCCMLLGHREFVGKYPVATKRVVRAILKATNLCATDPAWVARSLVDRGITGQFDHALQTLTDVRYGDWREYDPEDTVRFYALRMREADLIKSSPQKIIGNRTDWRFLNELKRELKG
jgi:NitT/TauT family transport system substrate-binding protein